MKASSFVPRPGKNNSVFFLWLQKAARGGLETSLDPGNKANMAWEAEDRRVWATTNQMTEIALSRTP